MADDHITDEQFHELLEELSPQAQKLVLQRAAMRELGPFLSLVDRVDHPSIRSLILKMCRISLCFICSNQFPRDQRLKRAVGAACDMQPAKPFDDDGIGSDWWAQEVIRRAIGAVFAEGNEDRVGPIVYAFGELLSHGSIANERQLGLTDARVGNELSNVLPLYPEKPGVWSPYPARGPAHEPPMATPDFWFWVDWYWSYLQGKPVDWDLQEAVALIPVEDWNAGPERVAERIREIEFDFRTRVDRKVIYDETTDILRLETDPVPPSDSLAFACKRVTLALENALQSGTANGLKSDSYETITIQSAVDQHPDDASVVAVSFYDACMSFERSIGETYPDDSGLINLKNALWTTAEEITELDENAKARVERYVQLGMAAPLTPAEQDAIPEMIEEVAPFIDDELDARLREVGDLLRTAPEPPRSARGRFANWMTTIVTWLDRAKKGEVRITWLVNQVERLRKWFPGDSGPPGG